MFERASDILEAERQPPGSGCSRAGRAGAAAGVWGSLGLGGNHRAAGQTAAVADQPGPGTG